MGKEPLMTLGTFRSGKALGWSAMESWRHEVSFCLSTTSCNRVPCVPGVSRHAAQLLEAVIWEAFLQ